MKTIQKLEAKSFLSRTPSKLSVTFVATLFLLGLTAFMPSPETASNIVLMPGVVFEIEVKDHEQSPPEVDIMEASIEGKNLKIGIPAGADGRGKGQMIFRGDRGKNGEMIIVDDDSKGYYVMDDATLESIMGGVDQSKKMMEEAMKGLTKEQRDMIEKMQKEHGTTIPGMTPPVTKPELTKTGEKDTKKGYPCVKYEVHVNGKKTREIWTTDWKNIDGGDEARDAFNSMKNFYEGIKERVGNMSGSKDMFTDLNFENGFPVLAQEFDENTGALEGESTLRSTRRQAIDPDAFEPPSGYKRQEMFGPRN
ncbi:hypothetical protein H7U19_14310 [Hyunsoonleella sp. SJ7]|uniref:DUF4412 domain-containing protein n=1 Tax=Hyunsoonleella aquatilis TaxID=2762758 RepID=A0A923HJS6_9FLAO|nr:hypothetical protein [Hyunsoonleella aquatilis]MBC3759587.1 hypothetical protein [Hyunsoonleella aquatilis]